MISTTFSEAVTVPSMSATQQMAARKALLPSCETDAGASASQILIVSHEPLLGNAH